VKAASDLLIAKARLAAEAGNEAEALRLAAAVQNLASHCREIETPSLLAETIVLLVDLALQEATLQHLLPSIGREADLPKWQAILSSRSYDSAAFAKVMRGEWSIMMNFFLLPVLVNKTHENCPPDADELARAMTSIY